MTMPFSFQFPVGDWSADGHEKCVYFTIESTHSLEDVRELYFQTREKFPSTLDCAHDNKKAICSDYEETSCTLEDLLGLGLTVEEIEKLDIEKDWEDEDKFRPGSDDIANLFVLYMMKHNPGLILNIKQDPNMLPFYGRDSKNRHIGHFGYGLDEFCY